MVRAISEGVIDGRIDQLNRKVPKGAFGVRVVNRGEGLVLLGIGLVEGLGGWGLVWGGLGSDLR